MRLKLYILLYYLGFLFKNDHKKSQHILRKKQLIRFEKLKKTLLKSSFYRNFAEADIKFEDYPIINKKVFMENFDQINTYGIRKQDALNLAIEAEKTRDFNATINGITVGLSTGTSGNKGVFLASDKERAKWVAAMLHRVVGFKLRKRKIAFFLRANSKLYDSSNSKLLQFNFFDLLKPHNQNFERLIKLNADILIAQPSALINIAKSFLDHQIQPQFKKVISVAEVLEEKDKIFLENAFQIQLDEVYQCTEGFLACTCKFGNLHFNEDFLIIEKEYLDQNNDRFFPIITDLCRITQPVIRYKLDDIIIEGKPCQCGSNFQTIEKIEGRADDVIKLKNRVGNLVDIYPDFFSRAIATASDDIDFYVLSQIGENRLTVYFEVSDTIDKNEIASLISNNIQSLLSKFDIDNTEIHFNNKFTLREGSKLRRIKNEYYKQR